MNYTTYDPATGEIIYNISISHADLMESNLRDHTYIEGKYSSDEYYIDQGRAIPLPIKPQDELEYCFDWTNKSWMVDQDRSMSTVRQQRNNLLSTVDRINPVWYASLTTEEQNQLVAYRQQLLDVPQQAGFPTDIVWPAKPTWL